jgi:hypothetical protein
MTDTPPPRQSDPNGRILRIALVLSLTANLIILGLILGAAFGRDRDRPGREAALADIGLNPFVAALPGADRRAIGRALIAHAGDLRQNRQAFRKDFEDLLAALRAEPYDPAVARAALESQRARISERQDLGRELLFERIAGMGQAERAAFADALADAVRRGPHRRGRDH